jgi:hypothetical protein
LQLGGAHGGAAGAGGQDAVAVAGKEHGVDQLGLAPRELGHEGHDELVLAQAVEQVLQPQVGLGIADLVLLQPLAQLPDPRGDVSAPLGVGGEMFSEHVCVFHGLHSWLGALPQAA